MELMPSDPYSNLDPAFTQRLQAFINASGGLVRPGSGYRTNQQQSVLYNAYKAGVPGQARAAPPGRSQHNHGLAMDLQYSPGGQEWAQQHAAEFGLYFPMDDEPWHVQPAGLDSRTQSGRAGLESAGINPQDELGSRIHSIMQILVGGSPEGTTPSSLTDPTGQSISPNPANSSYLANMFTGGGKGGQFTPTAVMADGDPGSYQQYALSKFQQFGWSQQELNSLIELWNKESNWNPSADNQSSSAAGIAQKMQSIHGAVESTPQGQIDWGLQYIANRYGSPSAALAFHNNRGFY